MYFFTFNQYTKSIAEEGLTESSLPLEQGWRTCGPQKNFVR